MSKDLPQQQQSEEVDLGQLFKLIGNAFDRFFKFIGSLFLAIYKFILLILIHFYKRKVWYVGAIILGLLLGFIIDMLSDKSYGANMFIETNFNSSRQVYENVSQFNQLANKENDELELAKRLSISAKEASQLKGFYIEPDIDENKVAEMYSEFYTKLDSISRSEMTYDRYKKSLTPYNFSIHKIGVASTDKNIYKKIEKQFVEQISGNNYLKELVEVNKLNLEKKEEALFKQVQKTDSLVNEYLKIRINESKKTPIPGAGTNLYMGNAESTNLIVDESKIIEKRLDLEEQRRQVALDMVEQQRIVNVFSDFPQSGYDITKWYQKMKFLIPLVLVVFLLLTFSIMGLGNFIKNQS